MKAVKYMTKIMVMPAYPNIDDLIDQADAILLGYKGMSFNFLFTVDLDYIEHILPIVKEKKKQLFIALNKNFHSGELDSVKKVMHKLADLQIDGILYYDVAVIQMKNEYKIEIPLIWGAEHLTTNYATMNYWNYHGADMTYVSGEITKQEILKIRKHTNMPLIVPILGHLPMFVSERHEVKNYLDHFQLNDQSSIYYMEKEGNRYPIIDNEEGTFVYSSHILNGYQEFIEFGEKGIDYVLCNENFIDRNIFLKIITLFHNRNGSDETIDTLLDGNTDKGFFYKETVYQVKHYD